MTLVTVAAPTVPAAPTHRTPRRTVADGTEARGFALFVGVDAADGEAARRLRRIVDDLRARLAEIAPESEAYASVVLAPVGTGGRSVDVVRRTVAEPGAAEVRRLPGPTAAHADGLVVDLSRRRVLLDGTPVPLTYVEQCLLGHLVRSEGRTVPRTEIVDALWSERDDTAPNERTVDVHVRRLRVKLGRYEDVIRTVRGVGYRFDQHADVTVVG
jgi:DNA-binding response OmpR family regulator